MLRLPKEDSDRLDALIPYVEQGARAFAVGRITRSAVVRAAVIRGLDVLEKEMCEHGDNGMKEPGAGVAEG